MARPGGPAGVTQIIMPGMIIIAAVMMPGFTEPSHKSR
jgi:hypothetical protein